MNEIKIVERFLNAMAQGTTLGSAANDSKRAFKEIVERSELAGSIIRKIIDNGCEMENDFGDVSCFFCGGTMEYDKPPNAGRILKENHNPYCPYEQARKFLEEIDAIGARTRRPKKVAHGTGGREMKVIGKTTSAIKNAPLGAIYIWPNRDTSVPKRISEELCRTDIEFVGPDWLDSGGYRGRKLTGVILDHATELTRIQAGEYMNAQRRVR